MNVAFHIRYARTDEVVALEALQLESSLLWESDRANLLANPDAIELPVQQVIDRQVRVIEHSGEVVGFSVVIPTSAHNGELDGLFVLPDQMRRGFGRALVDDAAAIARGQGMTQLDVIANPNVLAFYEGAGFVHVGMAETRFRPAPRMRLDL